LPEVADSGEVHRASKPENLLFSRRAKFLLNQPRANVGAL